MALTLTLTLTPTLSPKGGLLPGSCINVFLRYAHCLPACIAVSALHWLVWLTQVS